MSNSRIYIMSVAASGKSTFADRNQCYAGYKIVDFARELPRRSVITRVIQFVSRVAPSMRRFLDNRKDIIATNGENYFISAFKFMSAEPDPVVVLGRRTPDDLSRYENTDDIKFALVLVPLDDHKRNCVMRSKRLINSVPFFPHPTTDFSNMLAARKKGLDHAERQNIPVFQSFSDAIEALGETTAMAKTP